MDYMLKRWPSFARFLDDGRICLTNNAAERALRGGDRAAAMDSLIVTAKLNGIDPQAWIADTLRRINDHPAQQVKQLLPWNWKI
jgi:hypothetical protein